MTFSVRKLIETPTKTRHGVVHESSMQRTYNIEHESISKKDQKIGRINTVINLIYMYVFHKKLSNHVYDSHTPMAQ